VTSMFSASICNIFSSWTESVFCFPASAFFTSVSCFSAPSSSDSADRHFSNAPRHSRIRNRASRFVLKELLSFLASSSSVPFFRPSSETISICLVFSSMSFPILPVSASSRKACFSYATARAARGSSFSFKSSITSSFFSAACSRTKTSASLFPASASFSSSRFKTVPASAVFRTISSSCSRSLRMGSAFRDLSSSSRCLSKTGHSVSSRCFSFTIVSSSLYSPAVFSSSLNSISAFFLNISC